MRFGRSGGAGGATLALVAFQRFLSPWSQVLNTIVLLFFLLLLFLSSSSWRRRRALELERLVRGGGEQLTQADAGRAAGAIDKVKVRVDVGIRVAPLRLGGADL